MIRRFILGAATMLLPAMLLATMTQAADEPQTHVVLVLDCSANLAGRLAGEDSPAAFAAARTAAARLLARLAEGEVHGVSLVLFGHRIAADGEAGETEHLRLASGKLQRVPSGLDVEVIRHSRPLTTDDLDLYQTTLRTLEPRGASPLWLAITKAAECAAQGEQGQTRVVLLTNGANEQDEVDQPTSLQQALDALKSRGASLHVVQLGSARTPDDLALLAGIAEMTGGEVVAPRKEADVAEAVLVAAGLKASPKLVADSQVRPIQVVTVAQQPATEPSVLVQPPVEPARPDDEAILRSQLLKKDVVVEIMYWKEPVADATVYLRGKGFDLKYERSLEDKLLREQRQSGIYVFPKVLHGAYLLDISVNFRNRKYDIVREIVVDDDLLEPGRRLMIQIEKSKDPPPAPAPAPPQ
jgi:hypothetical protein